MFKFKRVIASLSMVAILSSFVVTTTALAGTFPDVAPDAYYYDAVETGVTQGWIDASNDTFDPARPINRAEASKMLCEAKGLPYTAPATPSFPDVQPGAWYYDSVECLAQNGVVGGYADGNFGPADPIQRQQFAKMVVNTYDLPESVCGEPTFPDVSESLWSYNFVETAYHWSAINGYADGRFGPLDTIIRADAAVMIVRAQNPVERVCEGGCEEGYYLVDDECVMIEGGELMVSLSSDSPETSDMVSIPSGSTGVPVAAFDFEAGDNDVVIENLTVKRTGVGDPDDFSKVYLYHDGMKLSNGKTINDSTNEALFNNIDVMIDAGETATIWVKVDIERPLPGSAGIHAFQVEDADAVTATADAVTGAFPVVGNDFGTSEIEAGAIDVESAGTDYTRKVGETDQEVAEFTIHVDNTEDALFSEITLYNDNDDILDNYTLWRGSEQVATGVKSGRYVTFTLDDPLLITRGEAISYDVHADVGGSDADQAELYVRYRTDVSVVGQTYGYNLFVDAAEGDNADSYCDEADPDGVDANIVTVEAGQLTVSFNGPVANDVPLNTNDVVLMDFSLTAQSNLDIEEMSINIDDGASGLNADWFNDISVTCNGVLVATEGTVEVEDGTTNHNVFNDTWSINAGETQECTVEIDIENEAAAVGELVHATLVDLTGAGWTIRDSDTNDVITDIVPSGDIQGNDMTITEASLDVDVASSPATGNLYVQGQDDVEIVAFVFTAGDSDDVTVNSVLLEAYLDDDQNAFADADDTNQNSDAKDVLSSITIYEEDTMTPLDTPDSLDINATNITVQFDTLNWVIPAGESRTLLVKSNISTTAPLGGDNDDVAIGITDVDAEYGTGSAITVAINTDNTDQAVAQEVADAGTVTLALDADTPDAAIIALGGADDILVTKAKFSAVDEAFNVEDLQIEQSEAGGDNNVKSVVIKYTDESGTEQTKSKPLIAGVATFSGLTPPIYVEKNQNTVVDVYVKTQSVDTGGTNDETIALDVIGTTGTFRAVGVGSGEVRTEADTPGDADGNAHSVYESYPTFEFTGLPTGDLIALPDTELGNLEITAHSNEDITFTSAAGNTITFGILTSMAVAVGTADDVFSIYEDGTLLDQATVDIEAGTVQFDFTDSDLTIGAGTTKTLQIKGDTSELLSEGDTVRLKLDDAAAGNVDWSIDGTGNFQTATVSFRGDLFGGTLVNP